MAGCAGGVELGTLDLHERKDPICLDSVDWFFAICYDHEETATKLSHISLVFFGVCHRWLTIERNFADDLE